jgi:hypothetical protein
MIVLLDSSVLGLICHSDSTNQEAKECNQWVAELLGKSHSVCIPEICDYETRRNLILENLQKSISILDRLQSYLQYLPVTTPVLLKAAELWAASHVMHRPTADKKELNVDIILCAQSKVSVQQFDDVVVATENVGHIGLFSNAMKWRNIRSN